MSTGNVFFSADLHFFHSKVIEFCNRPWANVQEMNEGLIANWNSVVGKRDKIYVLGDFCFGSHNRPKEILPRLNGYKILVRGNHDHSARKMLAAGFDSVIENETLRLPDGTNVLLSHFPYYPTQMERYEAIQAGIELDTRYLYKRILRPDDGTWLLHGHVHTQWPMFARQINVGVDVHDWKPVSVDTIQKLIKENS